MKKVVFLILCVLVATNVSSVMASPKAFLKPIIKSIDSRVVKAGNNIVIGVNSPPRFSRQRFSKILLGTAALPVARDRDAFEYAMAKIIDNQVNPAWPPLFGDYYVSVDWGKHITPTESILHTAIRYYTPGVTDASYYNQLIKQAVYYNSRRSVPPSRLKQRTFAMKYAVPPRSLTSDEWHLVQYLKEAFPKFNDLSKQVLESEDFVFAVQPWNHIELVKVIGKAGNGGHSAELAKVCTRQEVKDELRWFKRASRSRMGGALSETQEQLGETVQSFTKAYARSLVSIYRDGMANAYGDLPKLMNSIFSKVEYDESVVSVSIVDLCEHEVTVKFRPGKDVVIGVGEAEYVRIPELFGLIKRYERYESQGLGNHP